LNQARRKLPHGETTDSAMFLPFGAIFLHRPKHTRPPCNHGREPRRPLAPLLTRARRRTMIPGLSSEECGNHGSSLPTLPSLRPPPLPTKSRTATPSIPQRPMVIPPRAASRRPRLWRGGASERASRGLSAAADPPSQGAPLAARPPLPRVPRRERRRRSLRPSLTCREVRLLLLRTAAARCPCLPSHRPHAGPRASNHCSAGARSLAPVSSITRHTISSPFALF